MGAATGARGRASDIKRGRASEGAEATGMLTVAGATAAAGLGAGNAAGAATGAGTGTGAETATGAETVAGACTGAVGAAAAPGIAPEDTNAASFNMTPASSWASRESISGVADAAKLVAGRGVGTATEAPD